MLIRFSGDLGDCIFSLGLIRNLGGQHDVIISDNIIVPLVSGSFIPKLPLVEGLIKAQPYVKSLRASNTIKPDLCLLDFRKHHQRWMNLLEVQIHEAEEKMGGKMSHDHSPWLSGIEPHSYSYGRIIVARSARYHNPYFPWKDLVANLSHRMLFVGSREEHREFEEHYGWVEYFITKDLLEVAQLIKGADAFIGNQSSPHAVAIGLGGTVIQETSLIVPDCIFKGRPNVIYGTDLKFTFEGETYGDYGLDEGEFSLTEAPPGLWQFEGERSHSLAQVLDMSWNKDRSVNKQHLRKKIIHDNVMRVRGHFFMGRYVNDSPWKEAFAAHGIPYKPNNE